jgi:endonuclease III
MPKREEKKVTKKAPKKAVKKATKKVDKHVPPLCARCGEEPRWLVNNRKTGVEYFHTYGRNCENARQKANRAKRVARKTTMADIGLNKAPVAALRQHGIETIRDAENFDGELVKLDGVGHKTAKQITAFLVENGLS